MRLFLVFAIGVRDKTHLRTAYWGIETEWILIMGSYRIWMVFQDTYEAVSFYGIDTYGLYFGYGEILLDIAFS